jgi:hypothetical protein
MLAVHLTAVSITNVIELFGNLHVWATDATKPVRQRRWPGDKTRAAVASIAGANKSQQEKPRWYAVDASL